LEQSQVLLSLIDPGWMDVKDDFDERRLRNPKDWVRREIETARKQSLIIVPVLHKEVNLE